ncbi:MAG: class I adenylate-forming enzyme family protein [Bryobacteraceae bacterium]
MSAAGGVAVLVEDGPTQGAADLDQQWNRRQSFVYVQKKSAAAQWLAEIQERIPTAYREDHFGLLTSGSTGAPKLVIGRKDRAEMLARVLHEAQDSGAVRETIVALPLSYCYAFVNQWLWSRVLDRKLVMTAGFAKPDLFREALRRADDAMLCLVGSQAALLRDMFQRERFPGVIRLHFAGGRFPQEHLEWLREIFPNAAIFNNYGCAEALPRLTVRRAEDSQSASDIGAPLPGVELRSGESNELLFRSRYRCVAQLDGEGFHEIASDRWMPNGDLVRTDGEGHWHLLGRSGEVFKRHGEKIALPQVLGTVNQRWNGQVGYYREKDSAGEDGYVLVLSPQPDETNLRGVMLALRSGYKRTHWPLRIEGAPALPLTSNGKLAALAAQDANDRTLLWRQRL